MVTLIGWPTHVCSEHFQPLRIHRRVAARPRTERKDGTMTSISSERSTVRLAPAWVRFLASIIRRLPFGRYRALRQARGLVPSPFWIRLPTNLGGALFLCNLRDDICAEACFAGQYEPQESLLLRTILQPGMTFVDVGANWGYFSLVAAACVGSTGRVISLEPDPRVFKMIEQNFHFNSYTHARAFPIAAGRESGSLTLAGYPEEGHNWGISRLSVEPQLGGPEFQVQARSLDDLLTELSCPGKVDLVKIDIEGA